MFAVHRRLVVVFPARLWIAHGLSVRASPFPVLEYSIYFVDSLKEVGLISSVGVVLLFIKEKDIIKGTIT